MAEIEADIDRQRESQAVAREGNRWIDSYTETESYRLAETEGARDKQQRQALAGRVRGRQR